MLLDALQKAASVNGLSIPVTAKGVATEPGSVFGGAALQEVVAVNGLSIPEDCQQLERFILLDCRGYDRGIAPLSTQWRARTQICSA